MARKKKYRAIINPSRETSDFFESVSTFRGALRKMKREKPFGVELFEFDSGEELTAFLSGFEAGLGWMGEYDVITNTEI